MTYHLEQRIYALLTPEPLTLKTIQTVITGIPERELRCAITRLQSWGRISVTPGANGELLRALEGEVA